jgi:hypothetical protein
MVGCCEHGNEPSGSLKCRENLDSGELGDFQEGFCSMYLVSQYVSHSTSQSINQSFRIRGSGRDISEAVTPCH